jgi:phosphoglycolate phosphatase
MYVSKKGAPLSVTRFTVLILDFDGTIADTAADISWCMRRTFASFGRAEPSERAVFSTMGLPLEMAIAKLYRLELSTNEISDWVTRYRNIYNTRADLNTQLYPGTKRLLTGIRQTDMSVFVLTNKAQHTVESTLERLGIRHLINNVLGDGTTNYKKPDPRLFSADMKGFLGNVKNEQILVVGDTEIDLAFAKNADLSSCWARYGYGHKQHCRDLNPEFIIDSITELESVLES